MPKVACTLPNAGELINGVRFAPVDGEDYLLSEDVSDEVAAAFLEIPGYVSDGDASLIDSEHVTLLARAEAIGLKVDGRWKTDRLRTEVLNAEAKASS